MFGRGDKVDELQSLKRDAIKHIRNAKTKKEIQAWTTEGLHGDVDISSLLFATGVSGSVPGTTNNYKTYTAQIAAIYRKYNGRDDYGNEQVRAIVDMRTGFLAAEGLNISCKNKQTRDWINNFLKFNKLKGAKFIDAIQGGEMSGQSLFKLSAIDDNIKAVRIGCSSKTPYQPIYENGELIHVVQKNKDGKQQIIAEENFVYVCLGGDDIQEYEPTTKVGLVLTSCDNYDRAIKDMRRINHIFARVTPVFKTEDAEERKRLQSALNNKTWKIGQAIITSADFDFAGPKTTAHENLTHELVASIKNITAVTGCPVHWLGYVDLMSNRSTADSLYEVLKNATTRERCRWENAFYELILKAMTMAIDDGIADIKYDPDFSVKIPLLNMSNFVDLFKGLALGVNANLISEEDARNFIPGIDPIRTVQALEEQDQNAFDKIATGQNQIT